MAKKLGVGRELPARPIEPYEKGVGTSQGTTTYAPKFVKPPDPPEGVSRGLGMTDAEIEQYRKDNPKLYRKGGKVISSRNC